MLITKSQFARFDAAACNAFRADCRAELGEAYPHLTAQNIFNREAGLWDDCSRLGFASERAVQCYYFLSFESAGPLATDLGFMEMHERYVTTYGTANQLPIDLFETASLWARS